MSTKNSALGLKHTGDQLVGSHRHYGESYGANFYSTERRKRLVLAHLLIRRDVKEVSKDRGKGKKR